MFRNLETCLLSSIVLHIQISGREYNFISVIESRICCLHMKLMTSVLQISNHKQDTAAHLNIFSYGGEERNDKNIQYIYIYLYIYIYMIAQKS